MKRNNKIEKNILNHPFLTISTLFLNYLLRRSAEEVQKKCRRSAVTPTINTKKN